MGAPVGDPATSAPSPSFSAVSVDLALPVTAGFGVALAGAFAVDFAGDLAAVFAPGRGAAAGVGRSPFVDDAPADPLSSVSDAPEDAVDAPADARPRPRPPRRRRRLGTPVPVAVPLAASDRPVAAEVDPEEVPTSVGVVAADPAATELSWFMP